MKFRFVEKPEPMARVISAFGLPKFIPLSSCLPLHFIIKHFIFGFTHYTKI